MGKQARIRRSRKSKWKIATNQMLASCADPMCGACRGRGALYDPTRVCGCAVDGFRDRYAGRLRSRGWGLEVLVDRGP